MILPILPKSGEKTATLLLMPDYQLYDGISPPMGIIRGFHHFRDMNNHRFRQETPFGTARTVPNPKVKQA